MVRRIDFASLDDYFSIVGQGGGEQVGIAPFFYARAFPEFRHGEREIAGGQVRLGNQFVQLLEELS